MPLLLTAFLLTEPIPLLQVHEKDLSRFPSFMVAEVSVHFVIEFRTNMPIRTAFSTSWWEKEYYRDAMTESAHSLYCWELLRCTWHNRNNHAFVRMQLERLCGLIGVEAYMRGEMPTPVPLWYFRLRD